MSASTTRLNLTKPGGGSTGLILPSEPVDIDVINANMDAIDAAVGAPTYTSVTRPASPFDGQIIRESDTQRLAVYRQATTSWDYDGIYTTVGRGTRTIYYTPDLAGIDAISNAVDGDICVVENPGTGIAEDLMFVAIAGSGVGIDWRIENDLIADTKVNLDAFITAVAALVSTDVKFKVGAVAQLTTGIQRTYRFTSAAGALRDTLSGTWVPIVPSSAAAGSGTAPTISAKGDIDFSGIGTSLAINLGIAATDFEDVRMHYKGVTGGTGGLMLLRLRDSGGVDAVAANYDNDTISGGNVAVAATQALAQTSWSISDNLQRHTMAFDLVGLSLADPTVLSGLVYGWNIPSGYAGGVRHIGAGHRLSTAYTGVTIVIPAASTLTGRVWFEGRVV